MENGALIVAEKLDVAVVFSDKGMTKLLDEIKTKVISHVPDTTTDQGRKDITSLAYKITRSKTLIDDLGKGVVADWKKKAKLIDGHRKAARDFLDDLKNTARQPLTDWEAEQAIIKEKEEAAEREKIKDRVDCLFAVNVSLPFMDVALLTDAEYEDKLILATDAYKAEQLRIVEEQRLKEEEEAKLAIERAEIERIKTEQDAKAREQAEREEALKAQERAIEDAKRKETERIEREAFEKQAAENARVQAEKDATEKIIREKKEDAERVAFEIAEKERIEALRPDKEKLNLYAQTILDIPLPDVIDEESQAICLNAKKRLVEIATKIIKQSQEM